MSNNLEDFIRKNKQSFDDHEPSEALWKRLEKKMQEAEAPVVKINWWKWAAAAMIIITAGILSRPYWPRRAAGPLASLTPSDTNTTTQQGQDADSSGAPQPFLAHGGTTNERPGKKEQKQTTITSENVQPDEAVKEELFHYARLIEIKQKEIATLKNHHPELFEQFSQDLTSLNTSYSTLKKQYDKGLNSEQLLSAMIGNLKMQTELLNKQLEVTKKLKQKNDNDKTYKTI